MGISNCVGTLPKNLRNLEDLFSVFELDQMSNSCPSESPFIFGII